MQLKALDQFHISSVSADTLKPGQVFAVSDWLGGELMKKHPGKFANVAEKSEPAPDNKSEPLPKNKSEPGGKTNDPFPPDYSAMKSTALKALANERGVDISDAKNAEDVIAALQLSDEASNQKAD